MYEAPKPRRQEPSGRNREVSFGEDTCARPRAVGRGLEGVHRPANLGTPSPCFSPSLIKVRRVEGRGWNSCVGHGPAPPLPRPRPALSPQGQEARKEPPGAMDGSVMEGPLFLQSQRFGTKVVGGRGTEPHQNLGVGDRAQ